jgi:hypothetical protein
VEIQALLQDKDLDSKFSNDVRKYSHNYEGSMFFENYNFGKYIGVCKNKFPLNKNSLNVGITCLYTN